MRATLFGLVMVFFASPALACIQSAISNADFTEVCIGSICTRVQHAALIERSPAKREEELRELLQRPYDRSIPITELPLDDPDRATDPNRGGLYWSDDRGDRNVAVIDKTHLWSRGCEILVAWDGQVFQVSGRVP